MGNRSKGLKAKPPGACCAGRKAEAGAQGPAKAAHRVSPAGRKALARTGSANLAAWRAQQGPDLQAAVEKFEADLLADLGPKITAAQRALAAAATGSYAAILLASTKLWRTRGSRRLNSVLDRFSRIQGGLLRVLQALGVPLDSNRGEAVPDLESYLRENYGKPNETKTAAASAASAEAAESKETTDAEKA